MSFDRVLIVGLGETGRSLGLALKLLAKVSRVVGFDRDDTAARAAQDAGAIDRALDSLDGLEPTLEAILIAVPAPEAPGVVGRLAPVVPPGAIVTDLSPLMLPSVAAAASEPGLRDRFVPAHPVVERRPERDEPVSPERFRGATVLIGAPVEADRASGRVAELWKSVGAKPESIAPTLHDALVALTRDLPLLTAAALVRTLRRTGSMTRLVVPEARDRLRDSTRALSASRPSDEGELALNAPKLLPALELLEREVRRLRHALEAGEGATRAELAGLLEEARRFQGELVR